MLNEPQVTGGEVNENLIPGPRVTNYLSPFVISPSYNIILVDRIDIIRSVREGDKNGCRVYVPDVCAETDTDIEVLYRRQEFARPDEGY